MRTAELLALLGRLRHAQVNGVRAPHKPLLLLWLFARFAATGASAATYAELEEPVSRLINDFGPPVRGAGAARQRAAMPFVHLERDLWDVRDATGAALGPRTEERRRTLLDAGAVGRLRPEVEALLADPATLAAAAQLLLDQHFTPALAGLIRDAIGLDADVDAVAGGPDGGSVARRRARRGGFAEEVLLAYAYRCAMCGFDGALGRNPVGIEAAHVRWHSQDGPDAVGNALALCSLHHVLFDLGVLGLTEDRHIRVSRLYVARSEAGTAVHALADRPLLGPGPGLSTVDLTFVEWHGRQVFRAAA